MRGPPDPSPRESDPGDYLVELGQGRVVQLHVARRGVRTDVVGVPAPCDRRRHARLVHVPGERQLSERDAEPLRDRTQRLDHGVVPLSVARGERGPLVTI